MKEMVNIALFTDLLFAYYSSQSRSQSWNFLAKSQEKHSLV